MEDNWFNGPAFLLNNDFNIKTQNEKLSVNNKNMKSSIKKFTLIWECYSSFTKLIRHLAWIMKLLRNWLNWKRGHPVKEDFSYLKLNDIQTVEHHYFM